MSAVYLTHPSLNAPHINHAFFTRQGGVSGGVYASLNGGTGSKDDARSVQQNRVLMAAALHVPEARLLVPYQIHSADVVIVREPWVERPSVDGVVTNVPGLALGVTGADCGMILFADQQARVIGACHAGWKGALSGVLENTLAKMEELGAARAQITAVLGPMIGVESYEVGPEFVARFAQEEAESASFFRPAQREGHAMFDLPSFIAMRLRRAGIGQFENLGLDTYADEARFFSYRRMTHRREPDYGRLVSAIALV